MKRFVANLKATNLNLAALIPSKPVAASAAHPTRGTVPRNPAPPHTTGLQQKYVVPPVPYPCPHDHIALLVTAEGLLLRPHIKGATHPVSHVRIGWGKTVDVKSIEGDGEREGVEWNDYVIIYGIIGILELFSSSVLVSAFKSFL
jgi:hypothetical protein